MSYEVVLFDLGGVLVRLTGVLCMINWLGGRVDEEELWHRWLKSESVRRFESGAMGETEFARAMVEEFGLPVGPQHFLEEFTRWPDGLFPGALDLLREVAERCRIASLSNTNRIHHLHLQRQTGVFDVFGHNFLSHETGRMKPDAAAFEHAVESMGCAASRVLFLDDNSLNVDAARAVGLAAERVCGVEACREVLRPLGFVGG